MKDDKRNTQEEKQTQLRKVSRKRWFYPAIYLCVAALVMSGVLWMEKGNTGSHNNAASKKPSTNQIASNPQTNNQAAVPANTTQNEVLQWPVSDPSQVTIAQKFYNANGSQAEQVAALVNYDNTYAPNTGINLVAKDKKSFDVTAALSGTVTLAQQDPLLGYKVEVQNNNGVSTLYESLSAIDVQKGDQVHQGQLIGQAGTDTYNKAMGTHLHFEVRKDSVPVDPTAYWNKATTAVSSKPSKSSDQTKSQDQKKSSNQSGSSSQSGNQSSGQSGSNSSNNMNSGSSNSAQDSSNSTSDSANSGATSSSN